MLYQDTLTGMLHEVPDGQVNGWGLAEDPYGVGEGQVVYDGLGNPLGWGFLKKLVKKAAPFAMSALGPYGQILKTAIPVVSRALAPTVQAMRQQALQQLASGQPVPQQVQPQLAGIAVGLPRQAMYSRMPMSPVPFRPGMSPVPFRPPMSPVPFRRPMSAVPFRPGMSPVPMRPPWPAGWRRPQGPNMGPQPRRLYMRCSVWRGPGGLVPVNAVAVATPPAAAAVAPPAAARAPRRYRGRGRRR
jgi:hypothetical protein